MTGPLSDYAHRLRATADRAAAGSRGDGGERRKENRIDARVGPLSARNVLHERARLGDGLVHFPIAGNEWAHTRSSAAIPGSVLPSRNSSVAPPPVETCVMPSAKPSSCRRRRRSPPPTTRRAVSRRSAIASPRARPGLIRLAFIDAHWAVDDRLGATQHFGVRHRRCRADIENHRGADVGLAARRGVVGIEGIGDDGIGRQMQRDPAAAAASRSRWPGRDRHRVASGRHRSLAPPKCVGHAAADEIRRRVEQMLEHADFVGNFRTTDRAHERLARMAQ